MGATEPVTWRVDATTSRLVRVLWSLGVGAFFAAISIVVFWRVFMLAGAVGEPTVGLTPGTALDIAVTPVQALGLGTAILVGGVVLVLAATGTATAVIASTLTRLSDSAPTGRALERGVDAIVGTVVMMAVLAGLIVTGRIVSEAGVLATGAGPFTFLAAATVPLALCALVAASFLRSVGTIDPEEGYLYLHDPDERVALEHLETVSVRSLGDVAVVSLDYATPDGEYVPGPRRLVVPRPVAGSLEAIVES